jgi:hypothetical protein
LGWLSSPVSSATSWQPVAFVCHLAPRVRASSVIFVGTVLDAGSAAATKDEFMRDVTFQVDEIFTGLSPSVREVVVTVEGSWLIKGHSYLIDAANGSDHRLHMGLCGASGEIGDNTTAEFLDYLRQRAQGKAKTSLGVSVTDQYEPVSDVDVTIVGPEGRLTGRTGADGVATFTGLKPANYRVAAERSHYRVDPGVDSVNAVDVVSGIGTGHAAGRSVAGNTLRQAFFRRDHRLRWAFRI